MVGYDLLVLERLLRSDVRAVMVGDPRQLPARRQVARLLHSPGVLGTLNVGRSLRRGPASLIAITERVKWDREQ